MSSFETDVMEDLYYDEAEGPARHHFDEYDEFSEEEGDEFLRNIIGGLGDSIAQTAARNLPIPIEYVGTNDTFGESGTPTQLLEKYGLTAQHIIAAAEKVMARKKG